MKNKYILSTVIAWVFFPMVYLHAQETGTLKDSDDGRVYKTIKIGTQWWMAENLNYYTPEGSWCYNNDSLNCVKFGRLYDWETAKKVCPRGWHLPSRAEFEILIENTEQNGSNAYIPLIKNGISGFDALLGGQLSSNDAFFDLNANGYYWTVSQDYLEHIWYLNFYNENGNLFFYFSKNVKALSVRCLKN
ncbi:MAG: hypothetical protein BWY70_01504 [Bacteroidetes bacterium ADurb.Bin408]|nr:MAG: hypothetical protein BWY70_01504 [Bacteroidetes bacterium ADurb.Bin408]